MLAKQLYLAQFRTLQPCPQALLLSSISCKKPLPLNCVRPKPCVVLPAALRRKGKGDDVSEEQMNAVVHAHNTMNELTWRSVQLWEKLHCQECADAKLLRFQVRPGA